MAQLTRFGRRLALPSTRQIIHEMRILAAEEEVRKNPVAEIRPGYAVAGAEAPADSHR